jgi:hypothetical protein
MPLPPCRALAESFSALSARRRVRDVQCLIERPAGAEAMLPAHRQPRMRADHGRRWRFATRFANDDAMRASCGRAACASAAAATVHGDPQRRGTDDIAWRIAGGRPHRRSGAPATRGNAHCARRDEMPLLLRARVNSSVARVRRDCAAAAQATMRTRRSERFPCTQPREN